MKTQNQNLKKKKREKNSNVLLKTKCNNKTDINVLKH